MTPGSLADSTTNRPDLQYSAVLSHPYLLFLFAIAFFWHGRAIINVSHIPIWRMLMKILESYCPKSYLFVKTHSTLKMKWYVWWNLMWCKYMWDGIMRVIGLSLLWDYVCEGGCNPGDGTERFCQGCPWICLSDPRGEIMVLPFSIVNSNSKITVLILNSRRILPV